MSFLLSIAGDIINTITGVIGQLLFSMFSIIFIFIDLVQDIFRAFAGIGSINYGGQTIHGGVNGSDTLGGAANEQGIVYYLMQNEIVTNLLASIMLLALLLIVIFTTMAFLKNLYVNKPKGWKEIVGSAIKGLANFIFLPVCCLFGVWVGNILLQAINGATSSSGAVNMSRKLFICCTYDANLCRLANSDEDAYEVAKYVLSKYNSGDVANNLSDSKTKEYYAQIVDNVYAETDTVADIRKWRTVDDGYSLWEINYLIMIVGGVFMIYVLGSLAFGMVKRLFLLLVLFVISPAICALYPLDDGSAVKSWSGEFKKQVLSAYGAVAGLNIFFSILPLVEKIQIVGPCVGSLPGVNFLVQLFVMISGLMIVKDLIQLLSGYVGGDNAYSSGAGLMKGAHGHFKKHATSLAGKATGAVGAFTRAGAANIAAGGKWYKPSWTWLKSMGGSLGRGMTGFVNARTKELTGIDVPAEWKTIKGAGKEGKAAGALQKNTEKFHEDYLTAKEKVDRLEAIQKGYADGDITGEGSKFKYINKKGKEVEGTVEAGETSKKIEKKASAARAHYYKTIDDAPAEIRQAVFDKLGKKAGISGSEFDKKVQSDRAFFQAQSKAEASKAKLASADDKIDELFESMLKDKDGNDKVGKERLDAVKNEFNADMTPLVNALGLTFEDLAQYLKSGAHLEVDSIDFKSLKGIDRADVEGAAAVFNRRVDQEQGKRDAWQSDMDAFSKMAAKIASEMQAAGTKVKDGKNEVSIEDDNIKALADAIKEGKDLDGLSQAIVEAMSKDGKKREQSVHEVMSDLKEIRKLIEDARKK